MQDVTVVGLGYIGLPTCVALATQGVRVRGVDVDPEVVRQVNDGQVPFVEPDLAGLPRVARVTRTDASW